MGTWLRPAALPQLKAQLTQEHLVVDAADRTALGPSSRHLGSSVEGEGPFRLAVGGLQTHEVLRAIATPLTVVRTHAPSLEDAYLEIVGRTGGEGDEPTDGDGPADGGGPGDEEPATGDPVRPGKASGAADE